MRISPQESVDTARLDLVGLKKIESHARETPDSP